jgi:hypothetical protein
MAAELAGHFQECGDWGRVAQYLWLAAEKAWQRLAYREAISILGQALDTAEKLAGPERGQWELRLLERTAVLQHGLHDAVEAIATLEKLADTATVYGDVEVEARGLSLLMSMIAGENCLNCLPLLDRLENLAKRQDDPLVRAHVRVHHDAHRMSYYGWKEQLAAQRAADIEVIRQKADRLTYLSVLCDYSYLEWQCSRYAESLRHVEESLPAMLASGRLVRYLQGRDLAGVDLAFLGQWGRALDTLDQNIVEAERNEAPFRLVMPLIFKAWVHLNAMDFDGVKAMCDRARPYLEARFLRARALIARQLAASATLHLGDHATALRELRELAAEYERQPVVLGWYWGIPLKIDLVEACLAAGDLEQARIDADLAIQAAFETEERTWQGLVCEASARVALRSGDRVRASADVMRALAAMEGFDVPLAAWRVHATAAAVLGRAQDAGESRRIVLALAGSLGRRPDLRERFLNSRDVRAVLEGAQSATNG